MLLGDFRTTVVLQDLGQIQPDWSGIMSPNMDEDVVRKYIHAQFLDDASTYVARYQNTIYWKGLLEIGTQPLDLPTEAPLKVLDLGSGAGNTVLALFELYPQAHCIASDLSLPLLRSLKIGLEQSSHRAACILVQMNAEQILFEDNQMDLVVGGAILHHLFAPEAALRECSRVLKPGCSAVFFEPFEIGHQVITLILGQLIQRNRRTMVRRIPRRVVKFFEVLCYHVKTVQGQDKSDPLFLRVDDKWLFTRSYFDEVAAAAGFQKLSIRPIHKTQGMFLSQIKTLLRLGLQADESVLPSWALAHIQSVDQQFSEALRKELIIEGCVVLTK